MKLEIQENWKAYFLIFIFFLAVMAVGLLTYPCLGDETSFYRLAKGFFQTHTRWTVDPVYFPSHLIYFYNSEPLWPALLGFIWTLLGRESFAAAQIYHSLYFLALALGTYFFARRFADKKQAFLSVLILMTLPMVAAFSILFYVEIPMMAFLIWGSYFLSRKKIMLASLAISAAYLMKITVLFFFPAFLWLIFQSGETTRKKIIQGVQFTLPVLVTVAWDGVWRSTHLKMTGLFSNEQEPVLLQSGWQALKDRMLMGDALQRLSEYRASGLWEYTNSSLLNGLDAFKYFGVIALVFAVIFIFQKGYKYHRTVGVFILSYLAGFAYTCLLSPDVRYLLPAAPFLAMAAASSAGNYWHKPAVRFLISGMCLLQFSGAVFYVFKERRISAEIQEGFDFIQQHVPENQLTLYPEYVFIEKTNRGVVWSHRFRDKLKQLFWDRDKSAVLDYFLSKNIRYIAVKKERVYDDSRRRHFGGYPQSFVKQLQNSSDFKLLFNNSKISVWEINISRKF